MSAEEYLNPEQFRDLSARTVRARVSVRANSGGMQWLSTLSAPLAQRIERSHEMTPDRVVRNAQRLGGTSLN